MLRHISRIQLKSIGSQCLVRQSMLGRCTGVLRSQFTTGSIPRPRSTEGVPMKQFKDRSVISPPNSKKNTSKNKLRLINARIKAFPTNNKILKSAKSMGISQSLFNDISKSFVAAIANKEVPAIHPDSITITGGTDESADIIDRALLTAFFSYAEPHLPKDVIDIFNSMRKLSDLRFPNEWFPEARQMQRKIILHVGPTNSGKTYNALKRLEGAESGIYCGPLRLLANEIYEKMNDKGVACNLLTGEERRIVSPTAALTSSTVEMANLAKPIEVAVIDEIQMIGDPQRGWAWTQALLGLKAQEIHLCGEASVVPLVKEICASLNEEVIVNEYKRLTPVTILDETVDPQYTDVKAGDCVIAFSRTSIFNIKERIQESTGLKCAVVYGGLPPETRALQAKAFNDPESDIDVMVASDAVGMGLNLNIKRVVFSTIAKFNGKDNTNISIPQLKQIAGRAGRFGTTYASGEVTTIRAKDLSYVKECMDTGTIDLKLAGLQPTVDILEMFALQMPKERFSGLLQKFEDLASLSGNYFLCNFEDQKIISDTIERIKLPLRDRYQFVTAPVNVRNKTSLQVIEDLARIHSKSETQSLEDLTQLPDKAPEDEDGLMNLETAHKTIMLYMWLSIRYPETYITEQEKCAEIKRKCEVMIDDALKSTALKLTKKKGSYGQNKSFNSYKKPNFNGYPNANDIDFSKGPKKFNRDRGFSNDRFRKN